MGKSNHDVMKAFVKGNTGGKGSSMEIRGDWLFYRFNRWWHNYLAYRFPKEHPNHGMFLINGDTISAGMAGSVWSNGIQPLLGVIKDAHKEEQIASIIPFSSLESAKVFPDLTYTLPGIVPIEILHSQEDWYTTSCSCGEENPTCAYMDNGNRHVLFYEPSLERTWIMQEDVTAYCSGDLKTRHTLGATLFRVGGRYFLSSIDSTDRNYFLSELPEKCDSVEDAFLSLWPDQETYRSPEEDHSIGKVVRQGDIIATKRDVTKKALKQLAKNNCTVEKKSNYRLFDTNHVAEAAYIVTDKFYTPLSRDCRTKVYVHGRIFHRPGGRRRDHRTLRVPYAGTLYMPKSIHDPGYDRVLVTNEPGFWVVAKNKALGSWSAKGFVD